MGDCAAADDNPMKLMSIAMKPLCSPPFPLDYIEEMTALMGGDGRMRLDTAKNEKVAVPEKCSAAQMENWKKLCRRRYEKVQR